MRRVGDEGRTVVMLPELANGPVLCVGSHPITDAQSLGVAGKCIDERAKDPSWHALAE